MLAPANPYAPCPHPYLQRGLVVGARLPRRLLLVGEKGLHPQHLLLVPLLPHLQ